MIIAEFLRKKISRRCVMAKIKEVIVQMDDDKVLTFTWEEAEELFNALKELFEKEKQETVPYTPFLPYYPVEPYVPPRPYYTPSIPDWVNTPFTISTSDNIGNG